MSHKKQNVGHEVELLRVKLEQMEKRFDLLEKSILLIERTHRAELANVARATRKPNKRTKNHDVFSSDDNGSSSETSDDTSDEDSSEPVEKVVNNTNPSLTPAVTQIDEHTSTDPHPSTSKSTTQMLRRAF